MGRRGENKRMEEKGKNGKQRKGWIRNSTWKRKEGQWEKGKKRYLRRQMHRKVDRRKRQIKEGMWMERNQYRGRKVKKRERKEET